MTKSPAEIFTELTGGCWHEWEVRFEYVDGIPVAKYEVCKKCNAFRDGTNENQTYSNPADILRRMKEYLGEEEYHKFIKEKKIGFVSGIVKKRFVFINEFYVANAPALVDKANEYLQMKGE